MTPIHQKVMWKYCPKKKTLIISYYTLLLFQKNDSHDTVSRSFSHQFFLSCASSLCLVTFILQSKCMSAWYFKKSIWSVDMGFVSAQTLLPVTENILRISTLWISGSLISTAYFHSTSWCGFIQSCYCVYNECYRISHQTCLF